MPSDPSVKNRPLFGPLIGRLTCRSVVFPIGDDVADDGGGSFLLLEEFLSFGFVGGWVVGFSSLVVAGEFVFDAFEALHDSMTRTIAVQAFERTPIDVGVAVVAA